MCVSFIRILLAPALVLLLVGGCTKETKEGSPPNIIVVLADDLGYRDIGCFGGKAQTPNLDRLARSGTRFTNFYAAASNCSPSRTGYLTGINPSRVGMYSYRPPGHPMHLPDEEVTIAEILKKSGYATGHFGKWHLGNLSGENRQPGPLEQGFDFYFATENNAEPSHKDPVNFVKNGRPLGKVEGYSCQLVADEALNWLKSLHNKTHPFFLNISFHEPHQKIASPPDLIAHYTGESPFDATYFANIENMDSAFGRIYQYLITHQLVDNTVIIFASDNGSYRNGSNGELRALKSYVYEGGIRVPGIISWPGTIPSGVENTPAGLIDLFPTLANWGNANVPDPGRLDGTDLTPLWSDRVFARQKPLYWFFYRTDPEIAVRIGKYSILGSDGDSTKHTHRFSNYDQDYIQSIRISSFEAYDLDRDIEQKKPVRNLASPEIQTGIRFINASIDSIQVHGKKWENLPTYKEAERKFKKNWVPYDRN